MKKENTTLAQRIKILNWYHQHGRKQTLTANHFAPLYPNLKIKQPLVSSWVKDEAKWRAEWEQTNRASDCTAKRTQQTEHPEITEMMDLWVSKAMGDGIPLTGEILRQKWNSFADMAGIPKDERLKLSNGWLGCFEKWLERNEETWGSSISECQHSECGEGEGSSSYVSHQGPIGMDHPALTPNHVVRAQPVWPV